MGAAVSAWICRKCCEALRITWGGGAYCTYVAAKCGYCKRHCERGERREYHSIKIGDLW